MYNTEINEEEHKLILTSLMFRLNSTSLTRTEKKMVYALKKKLHLQIFPETDEAEYDKLYPTIYDGE